MSDRNKPGPDGSEAHTERQTRGRVMLLVGVAVVVVAVVILLALRAAGVFSANEPTGSDSTSAGPATPTASAATPTAAATSSAASASASAAPPTDGPSSTAATSRAPTASAKPQPTRSPVPMKTPAEIQTGLTASISDMTAIEGKAEGPGEVAGPAVRFTLTLRNSSDRELPLSTTVVNLYYGKAETPASELQSGASPLPATVAAGGEASATYVFVVPEKARDNVLITVDYSVDVSLVAFRGKAPR